MLKQRHTKKIHLSDLFVPYLVAVIKSWTNFWQRFFQRLPSAKIEINTQDARKVLESKFIEDNEQIESPDVKS